MTDTVSLKTPDIVVDAEFKKLIPDLKPEEIKQLEKNIEADGCRDPLVVWQNEGTLTLLDGHNRYEICTRKNWPFDYVEQECADRHAAKIWIIHNQFGRRNLEPYQRCELALELEALLSPGQGARTDLELVQNSAQVKDANERKTRAKLAEIAGVSHDTIAKAKVINKEADEDTKEKLRKGETSIHAEYTKINREKKETEREAKRNENQSVINQAPTIDEAIEDGATFTTICLDPPWDPEDQGVNECLRQIKANL